MSSAAATVPKPVPSPCIRECCLDQNNICIGCHRSLREICDWSDSSDPQRLEILERCAARRHQRDRRILPENGTDPGTVPIIGS